MDVQFRQAIGPTENIIHNKEGDASHSVVFNIFKYKVIYHETTHDWSGFVNEEAMGVGALNVALEGKMRANLIVSKEASLWQSIHAFAYLQVIKSAVDEVLQVVLVENSLGTWWTRIRNKEASIVACTMNPGDNRVGEGKGWAAGCHGGFEGLGVLGRSVFHDGWDCCKLLCTDTIAPINLHRQAKNCTPAC
jgi:hypothetical protein